MRQAPPVGVPATGGRPWRWLQTLLPAAAAGASGAWLAQHAGGTPAWGLGFAALAGLLAWRAARPVARRLLWDGQAWSVDGTAGRVQAVLDPGPLMLLRWHPDGGRAGWLAVSRHEAGHDWPALRAALYSPAATRTPAPTAPE